MSATQKLFSKDKQLIQLAYEEYAQLQIDAEAASKTEKAAKSVLQSLLGFMSGTNMETTAAMPSAMTAPPVSAEVKKPEPAPAPVIPEKSKSEFSNTANDYAAKLRVPSEIVTLFNSHDSSGRMLNVFLQYYKCVNDSCNNMLTVELDDECCRLKHRKLNADFAFIDIYEGRMRFGVDSKYTDMLTSLDICVASPSMLKFNSQTVCFQMDDLNSLVLQVLIKSFNTVKQEQQKN